MTEGFFKRQSTSGSKPKYGLMFRVLLLLGFAICLRLLFFTGPIYDESYEVVKGAYELATLVKENFQAGSLFNLLEIPSVLGWRKLSSYAPVSLFYLVGGISDDASVGFALLSSTISLMLLFLITCVWRGTKIALVGLFLWAFIPNEIMLATVPRLNTVFLPILLSSLLVFVLALERQKTFWVGISLFLGLPVLVLDSLLGTYLLFLLSTYFLWWKGYSKIVWYGLLGLALVAVLLYGSNAIINSYRILVEAIEGLQLIVILIIAITANWASKNKSGTFALAGLALTFLFVVIRQQSISTFEFSYEIEILLWMISMLAIAEYIAPRLEAKTINKFLILSLPLILLLVFLGNKSHAILIPDYRNLEYIGSTLLLFFKILAGVAILLAIISLMFLQRISQFGVGLQLLLLTTFSLSLLPSVWQEKGTQPYHLRDVYGIMEILQNQYLDLPVFVNETQLFNLLQYTSKFDESLQVFTFEKKTQIDNAFVVVREGGLAEVPSSWVQIDMIGRLGQPRLAIFRSLQADFAQAELATSILRVQENTTSSNLQRLYRAYMNVNEQCMAYSAWLQAFVIEDTDRFEYLIIEPNDTCFTYENSEDLFEDLFQSNQGNSFSESGSVYSNQIRVRPLDDSGGVRIFHWNKFYPDPRIFDIEIILEPGKVYLYEATIRSRSLVTTLYWAVDGGEFAAYSNDFPEWRQVSILMVTPTWAEPTGVKLSPVLFDHFAFVDLKNAHLIEVGETNYSFDLH